MANLRALHSPENTFMGFPKIRGAFLGIPIIRTIVFWVLYWDPFILVNYHMERDIGCHNSSPYLTCANGPWSLAVWVHEKDHTFGNPPYNPVVKRSAVSFGPLVMIYVTIRVQVLNNHILTQNQYDNYGYMDPWGYIAVGFSLKLGGFTMLGHRWSHEL